MNDFLFFIFCFSPLWIPALIWTIIAFNRDMAKEDAEKIIREKEEQERDTYHKKRWDELMVRFNGDAGAVSYHLMMCNWGLDVLDDLTPMALSHGVSITYPNGQPLYEIDENICATRDSDGTPLYSWKQSNGTWSKWSKEEDVPEISS